MGMRVWGFDFGDRWDCGTFEIGTRSGERRPPISERSFLSDGACPLLQRTRMSTYVGVT